MFLARIVSRAKIPDIPSYIEVTGTFVDDGIPTLVVGKKRAVELFGQENIHVLERSISDTVSWTYAKNERRVEYEEDIKHFKDAVTLRLISGVEYYFVNIFIERYSFFKRLIKWFDSEAPKSVYITENHMYAYGGKNVIGISLADLNYAGIDSDKVVGRVKRNPSNTVFTDNNFIGDSLRKSVLNNNIIVPYIHFLTR